MVVINFYAIPWFLINSHYQKKQFSSSSFSTMEGLKWWLCEIFFTVQNGTNCHWKSCPGQLAIVSHSKAPHSSKLQWCYSDAGTLQQVLLLRPIVQSSEHTGLPRSVLTQWSQWPTPSGVHWRSESQTFSKRNRNQPSVHSTLVSILQYTSKHTTVH